MVNVVELLQSHYHYPRLCVTLMSMTSAHMTVFGGEIYAQHPCVRDALNQMREVWAPASQTALEVILVACYCTPLSP